jgi:hypothetical protein
MTRRVNFYHGEGRVLHATENTWRLGAIDTETLASTMSSAGGQKIVPLGAIWGSDNKLLKRAVAMGDAPIGATKIYTNNPWAFAPGDVLKVIAPLGSNPQAELAAINGGGGATIGTIASVDASVVDEVVDIAIASAIVGNVVSVDIGGIIASYAIASTTLADELKALAAAINKAISYSEDLRYLVATATATAVRITVSEPNYIVDIAGTIAQGSAASVATLTNTIVRAIGAITLTAPLAAALANGTKFGTLTQTALGIFEQECDLTIYPSAIPVETAITPIIGGYINTFALKYIDAQVVNSLTKCAFEPAYV